MRTQKARFVFLFVLILALVAFPTSVSANHSSGKYQALTINDAERYYQGEFTLGTTVTGSLGPSEPVHYWGFGGTAGDAVFVDLVSPEGGDGYLQVYVENGTDWDLIAEIDYCQGTLNACLDLSLPRTGRYLVGATTYRYASSGRKTSMNYELTVYCTNVSGVCTPVDPGPTASLSGSDAARYYQGDLTHGVPVSGSLRAAQPIHYWGFDGAAADAMFVDLVSPEGGDGYLQVYVENGTDWDLIAEIDYCQGTLNACLDLSLPQTGRYLVGATTYRYVSSGRKTAMNYDLTVYCTNASGVCGAVAVAEGGN